MSARPPRPRLHLFLQPTGEEIFEPDAVAEVPLVRFSAFAPSERIFGWVRLRADRLTDLLNAHDELLLSDVEIEDLERGERRSEDAMLVPTRALVAVLAAGPRGADALRRRTRAYPVAMQSGRYLIGGHLHAAPGAGALASLRQRPPMIPLTDAWIDSWSGRQRTCLGVGTIVVNRRAMEQIRLVTDEDLLDGQLRPTPALPVAAP